MKRVMEDERCVAARTDLTFRPMRRKEAKVALGSKMKRAMEDERFTAARTDPRFRPMWRKEAKVALSSKMKRAMENERLTAARIDPRFRPMRRKEAKVALNSRFTPMLTDPMFDSSLVDKHGRRRKNSARENPMLHYYLNEEVGDKKDKEKTEQEKLICEEEDHELEEEDGLEEEDSSSSDDEEDDDDQYSMGCDIAHYLMCSHDDTHMIDKETHRLAVVNMDLDHIKAVDLYMVMTSCIPKGGRVLSVSIYPTEFGLKCMNIEATEGPSALIGADCYGGDDGGEDDDNDNGYDDGDEDDFDTETENNKLRTYGLNKLRYYYAVVVCDSSATADHLYTTLDGTEFLKTANVFDLQFIYDSWEFKYPARDVATETHLSCKEPDFETFPSQHTKVKPTWDDDEPVRMILMQKFKHQFGDRYKYVESDESASEDVDDSGYLSLPNGVSKWKLTNNDRLALLLDGNNSDEERRHDQDMEITFNMELDDLSKRILERKVIETKTIWEMHQGKMKEKQKARKRWSKDDDDYINQDSTDDFLDEKLDEAKPMKKSKVKAKGKGKTKSREEHYEPEATKEECHLVRKQAGKKGVHVGTLDSEEPVEGSSPPDYASTFKANRKTPRICRCCLLSVLSRENLLRSFIQKSKQDDPVLCC